MNDENGTQRNMKYKNGGKKRKNASKKNEINDLAVTFYT